MATAIEGYTITIIYCPEDNTSGYTEQLEIDSGDIRDDIILNKTLLYKGKRYSVWQDVNTQIIANTPYNVGLIVDYAINSALPIYLTPTKKETPYLDHEGLKVLWNLISMEDYPNNDMLIAVLNAVDETKADKEDIPSLKEYYDEENQVLTLLHNKEITFYIDEDEYKCEEGMLWTELINGTNTYYSIPVLFFNDSVYPFEYDGRNFDPAGNGPINMQSYTTVYGGSPEK